MDNSQRIEDFLKQIAATASSGENINMSSVYSNLVYLGIDAKAEVISQNFDVWERYFEGKKNVFCFVQRDWEYFCQFINSNKDSKDDGTTIKLYISLDKEHITEGVIRIVDFLAKENIAHESKVGSHVRFDDVVIRVKGKENADKVINFINNDEYLKSGFLPNSPFAITEGNISMALDGHPSYNTVVASWIGQYINWEKDNSNLNNVSYTRFYEYVNTMLNSIFTNEYSRNEYANFLIRDRVLKNDKKRPPLDRQLTNYYYISKLLLMSMLPHKNKNDLYNFVDQINNQKMQSSAVNNNGSFQFDRQKVDNRELSTKRQLLKIAFDNMVEYYGYEKAKCQFQEFIKSGNYDYITRYKNTRDSLLGSCISKEDINNIVFYWKREGLDSAIRITRDKYGFEHANAALDSLMRNKNFSNFTNDYNCRIELIKRFADGDVALVIHEALGREGYDTSQMNYDALRELYMERFTPKGRKIT